MHIYVVIPAYNEEERIRAVIRDVRKKGLPIIVVDDGSNDKTFQILSKLKVKSEKLKVLRHKVNLGKGAAMKTGAEAAFLAGADAVIFMDSDGQHKAEDLHYFIDALEKEYGTRVVVMEETVAAFDRIMKSVTLKLHKPVKKKPTKRKKSRTLVAQLSDTHYGCRVAKQEVGGLNEWNWVIAARRTAFFMEQIASYKPQYRKQTDLILCLNGDILAGLIHNPEWFAEPLATQFAGALHILGQAISYLANQFQSVKIYCTPGNHGRAMHKFDKGRVSTHKWDGYETLVYRALKNHMEEKYKNVEFFLPETPYATFEVHGHLILQTHGDSFFNVGDPGKNINVKGINEQIHKLNASKIGGRKRVEAVLVGHVHTPTMQLTDSGCTLFINGCLIGTDPFAQSIGIMSSHPAQWLFEATPEHAIGDQRLIKVKQGDTMEHLDKIIEPWKGKF